MACSFFFFLNLQNLSKSEVATNESRKLHKSGSLSQVFTEVGGTRVKVGKYVCVSIQCTVFFFVFCFFKW